MPEGAKSWRNRDDYIATEVDSLRAFTQARIRG
jgi:hypothetical protein